MKLIIGRSSKLLGEREKYNDESFSEKCENFNQLPSLLPLQFNLSDYSLNPGRSTWFNLNSQENK